MNALVVRAVLAGPLVDNGHPVHLDGLLELAWIRRHAPDRDCADRSIPRWASPGEFARSFLPLREVVLDGLSVWACSAAIYGAPSAPAAVWQTKRRDPEDWDALGGPVRVTAGPTKDYRLRRAGVTTREVYWLAWGVRREVVRALRLLWGRESSPHGQLGSVRRSGAGQILSWGVDDGSHDPDDCFVQDGIVRRHLPIEWLEDVSVPGVGACAPPYWLIARQRPIAVIGTCARLRAAAMQAVLA